MVDIPCHILPGVDDGARSLEEACAMVEMAAVDGVTQLVATPLAIPSTSSGSSATALYWPS